MTSCFLNQISSSGVIVASLSASLNKAVLVDVVVDSVGGVVVELVVVDVDVDDDVDDDGVVEGVVVEFKGHVGGDVLLSSSVITCSMKMSLKT